MAPLHLMKYGHFHNVFKHHAHKWGKYMVPHKHRYHHNAGSRKRYTKRYKLTHKK